VPSEDPAYCCVLRLLLPAAHRNTGCCQAAHSIPAWLPPCALKQDLPEEAGTRGRITVYCVAESIDRKVWMLWCLGRAYAAV